MPARKQLLKKYEKHLRKYQKKLRKSNEAIHLGTESPKGEWVKSFRMNQREAGQETTGVIKEENFGITNPEAESRPPEAENSDTESTPPEHQVGRFKQSELIKKLDDNEGVSLYLLHCPQCDGIHFRHAGYVEVIVPYSEKDKEVKSINMSQPVKMCVACKHSIFQHEGNIYDVTGRIDIKAWMKTEKEAHEATGPGGQC